MTVWPVFVEDWQLECCGDPFAVGDRVAWQLRLSSQDDARVSEAHVRLEDAEVVLVDGEHLVLRVGGLVVAWRGGAGGAQQPVTTTGLLVEDHHGDVPPGTPRTEGVVRAIRVVRQPHRLRERSLPWSDGPVRALVAIPGPVGLRDVERTTRRFDQTRHGRGDVQERENGLLVDLDVDDAGIRPATDRPGGRRRAPAGPARRNAR